MSPGEPLSENLERDRRVDDDQAAAIAPRKVIQAPELNSAGYERLVRGGQVADRRSEGRAGAEFTVRHQDRTGLVVRQSTGPRGAHFCVDGVDGDECGSESSRWSPSQDPGAAYRRLERRLFTTALASLMALPSSPCAASCSLATATHCRFSASVRSLWCRATSSLVQGIRHLSSWHRFWTTRTDDDVGAENIDQEVRFGGHVCVR